MADHNTVLPSLFDNETPPSEESRDGQRARAEEIVTLLEELRKLQENMRKQSAQVLEGGTDTAIWETRGGMRMLNMIVANIEARAKALTTQ